MLPYVQLGVKVGSMMLDSDRLPGGGLLDPVTGRDRLPISRFRPRKLGQRATATITPMASRIRERTARSSSPKRSVVATAPIMSMAMRQAPAKATGGMSTSIALANSTAPTMSINHTGYCQRAKSRRALVSCVNFWIPPARNKTKRITVPVQSNTVANHGRERDIPAIIHISCTLIVRHDQ
jgi:hypothetical protein